MKLYLAITGGIVTDTDETGRIVRASGTDCIYVGVRSRHEFPAATLTTTDEPEDVMRVISAFGSALKTSSPERSWPTLRGYPPLVELGDQLSIPETLQATRETPAVTIEVPPQFESIFPVASLSFYLNADIVPGEKPRLLTGEASHALDEPDFETAVEQTLKQIFLLDCVVRTEGIYPVDLAERDTIERRVGLDLATLYEAPVDERIDRYLDVPYDVVERAVPRWKTTADVQPVSASVEQLPFIVADLGLIRCPKRAQAETLTPVVESIDEFSRGDVTVATDGGTAFVRGMRSHNTSSSSTQTPQSVVGPHETDSIEHVWVGDGYPMRAAKPTIAARKRRLRAQPSGSIDVAVVLNDSQMQAETDVRELYGLRELVQFEVEAFEGLSRDALVGLLAEDYDFIHYIGHVDDRGIQCVDGYLDAATLDRVRTRAFVLNACRSYKQGMHLIEAGAIAGLVTLTEIGNMPATRIGQTLARLLNTGFSLGGALDILSTDTITARQYMVVGDPNLTLASSKGSTPIHADIERINTDQFSVSLYGYPTSLMGLGTILTPHIAANDRRYLNSGHIADYTISGDQLEEFFRLERFPIRVGGELYWNDTLQITDI